MPSSSQQAVSDKDRSAAAMSYVWILCLYPLLFKRKSAFIRFHAKQGLALFVIETLSFLFFVLAPIVIIICIVLSLIGIKASLEGKYWKLPLVGDKLQKTEF